MIRIGNKVWYDQGLGLGKKVFTVIAMKGSPGPEPISGWSSYCALAVDLKRGDAASHTRGGVPCWYANKAALTPVTVEEWNEDI